MPLDKLPVLVENTKSLWLDWYLVSPPAICILWRSWSVVCVLNSTPAWPAGPSENKCIAEPLFPSLTINRVSSSKPWNVKSPLIEAVVFKGTVPLPPYIPPTPGEINEAVTPVNPLPSPWKEPENDPLKIPFPLWAKEAVSA